MNKFYIILFEIYIYLFSNAVGIRAYSVASGSVIVIGSLLAYAFSIVWDGDIEIEKTQTTNIIQDFSTVNI